MRLGRENVSGSVCLLGCRLSLMCLPDWPFGNAKLVFAPTCKVRVENPFADCLADVFRYRQVFEVFDSFDTTAGDFGLTGTGLECPQCRVEV